MLGIDDQKDLSEKRLKKLIQSHTDDENYFKLFENERKWFELVRLLLQRKISEKAFIILIFSRAGSQMIPS